MKLEVHPDYIKDKKKIKLNQDHLEVIKKDLKKIIEGVKQGKLLVGTYFPLRELKYRKWGIRLIYIEEKDKIIVLSINRKKDHKTEAYKDAIKRLK